MAILTGLYGRYGVWRVRGGLVASIVLLVAGGYFVFARSSDSVAEMADTPLAVKVAPIGTLGEGSSRSFVGTVSAVNQARVMTETGGRVVAVPVRLGDRVRAGAVIAQLENASERAALTQAQGAYEAAKANALQGDSGVRNAEIALSSAQTDALTTLRSAYTTANGVLVTDIDQFFSAPQSAIPGLRVTGPTAVLNPERIAFQSMMPKWQQEVASARIDSDLEALLRESAANTGRLITMLDTFISITTTRDEDLAGRALDTYTADLLTARAKLDGVVNSLSQAGNAIATARETLSRTQVSGTSASVSLANAQLTQALGSLQAAQAAYNKTIVRSPIAGTINALQVKVGDSLATGAGVAEVVNDSAYEMSIFVTESERATINVGDSVRIGESASGTITSIAPALDARTQKVEVKIALESKDKLSGSTAVVSFAGASKSSDDQSLSVPITAVAFSVDDGALFTVTDGVIAPIAISLGEVRGSHVVISGDIDPSTLIVTDARGLIVGQKVTVSQ